MVISRAFACVGILSHGQIPEVLAAAWLYMGVFLPRYKNQLTVYQQVFPFGKPPAATHRSTSSRLPSVRVKKG